MSSSSNQTEKGPLQGPIPPLPPKRGRIATQACHFCRRGKLRCNGDRPQCSNCVEKNRPCGYEGEAGQSRQAAAKSRLETLESLITNLQVNSLEEASDLLQQIRSTKDLKTLCENNIVVKAATEKQSNHPVAQTPGELTESFRGNIRNIPENTYPLSLSGCNLISVSIPNPAITHRAIDGFFNCSGKLFHVFSREQVADNYDLVFDQSQGDKNQDKATICCTAAVAAVGTQYMNNNEIEGPGQSFYDVARYYFEAMVEDRPFDAIKVCVLLSMFNIMQKETVALAYVEVGLSMARRFGLDRDYYAYAMPSETWIDYRKSWRTLIFLSSWLCSTLGYISGNIVLMEKVPLSSMDVDKSSEIENIVQREMSKISLLKADILRMNLAFKDLTVLTMNSILEELQSWYKDLPAEIHIGNLTRADLQAETRRSIYHIHLLYLGAMMLLYRRISYQFVRSYKQDNERDILWGPLDKLISFAEEGVIAAKHSARILSLLLAENGVFKRCWLVIFHAYVSCIIILHSVAQKQLHNFNLSECKDDLQYAKICLSVLEFCASADRVAGNFHAKLIKFYNMLIMKIPDYPASDIFTTFPLPYESTKIPVIEKSSLYLFTIPPDSDKKSERVSLSLLIMLCRPFGDAANKSNAEENNRISSEIDPSRFEHSQMMERLDLQFESGVVFKWNIDHIGSDLMDGIETSNLFLDSSRPSGWLSEPEYMNKEG